MAKTLAELITPTKQVKTLSDIVKSTPQSTDLLTQNMTTKWNRVASMKGRKNIPLLEQKKKTTTAFKDLVFDLQSAPKPTALFWPWVTQGSEGVKINKWADYWVWYDKTKWGLFNIPIQDIQWATVDTLKSFWKDMLWTAEWEKIRERLQAEQKNRKTSSDNKIFKIADAATNILSYVPIANHITNLIDSNAEKPLSEQASPSAIWLQWTLDISSKAMLALYPSAIPAMLWTQYAAKKLWVEDFMNESIKKSTDRISELYQKLWATKANSDSYAQSTLSAFQTAIPMIAEKARFKITWENPSALKSFAWFTVNQIINTAPQTIPVILNSLWILDSKLKLDSESIKNAAIASVPQLAFVAHWAMWLYWGKWEWKSLSDIIPDNETLKAQNLAEGAAIDSVNPLNKIVSNKVLTHQEKLLIPEYSKVKSINPQSKISFDDFLVLKKKWMIIPEGKIQLELPKTETQKAVVTKVVEPTTSNKDNLSFQNKKDIALVEPTTPVEAITLAEKVKQMKATKTPNVIKPTIQETLMKKVQEEPTQELLTHNDIEVSDNIKSIYNYLNYIWEKSFNEHLINSYWKEWVLQYKQALKSAIDRKDNNLLWTINDELRDLSDEFAIDRQSDDAFELSKISTNYKTFDDFYNAYKNWEFQWIWNEFELKNIFGDWKYFAEKLPTEKISNINEFIKNGDLKWVIDSLWDYLKWVDFQKSKYLWEERTWQFIISKDWKEAIIKLLEESNDSDVLHEISHNLNRYLWEDIQKEIDYIYETELNNIINNVWKNEEGKKIFKEIIDWKRNKFDDVPTRINDYIDKIWEQKLYRFTNKMEFFAEEMKDNFLRWVEKKWIIWRLVSFFKDLFFTKRIFFNKLWKKFINNKIQKEPINNIYSDLFNEIKKEPTTPTKKGKKTFKEAIRYQVSKTDTGGFKVTDTKNNVDIGTYKTQKDADKAIETETIKAPWDSWVIENKIIKYNPESLGEIESHLNIVQSLWRKSFGKATMWLGGKLYDNIGKFLNNVQLKINWQQVGFWDVISGLDQQSKALYDNVNNLMWVDKMDNIFSRNVSEIKKWYDFMIKNINSLFPWENINNKMMRNNIELAKENNTLDQRLIWEKKPYTSTAVSLNNWFFHIAETKMRELSSGVSEKVSNLYDKLKEMDSRWEKSLKSLTPEEKAFVEKQIKWGNTVKKIISAIDNRKNKWMNNDFMQLLSDEQKQKAIDDTINLFPESVRPYLIEISKEFNPFIEWTAIRKWFAELWQELENVWILRWTKEWYIHWVINKELFKKWKDRLSDEDRKILESLWIEDWYGMMKRLKDIVDPEQRSRILKTTKNMFFLQSRDPYTIARSYASEVSKLIKEKQIQDIIEKISKDNSEVWAYLWKELLDEHARIYKIIRGIPIGKSLLWKIADAALTPVSFGQLVWNVPWALQNLSTTSIRFVGQMLQQGLRWEISFTNLPKWTFFDTFNYLHNIWYISNKAIDNIDHYFRGTWTVVSKIKGVNKLVTSILFKLFTSIWEAEWQTISAIGYMNSIVKNKWGWIKEWESLMQAYKRTLDWLSEWDRLIIESWLSENVRNIGDWTKISKWTTWIFDNKIFNIFKTFWRDDFSKRRTNIENTIDRIWERVKWDNKAFEWISKDIIPLITNTVWMFAAIYSTLSAINSISKIKMNDDEFEESLKRLFTDSVKNWFGNYLSAPFWTGWVTWIIDNIANILTIYKRVETGKISIAEVEKTLLHFFWGLERTLRDTMPYFSENFNGIVKTSGGNFKFQNKTYSNPMTALLGISKEKAGYNKSIEEIQKIEDLYLKSDKNYEPIISWIIKSISLNSAVVNNFFSNLNNLNMIDWIDKINSNIKWWENIKLTPTQWIENAFDWVESADTTKEWWIMSEFKKNLWTSIVSQWKTNYQAVANISKLIDGIKSFNTVNFYPDDFNRTIKEFREKQPEQYSEFIAKLYSFTANPWGDENAKAIRKVFIDSKIADEMWGARLWWALADKIRQVIKEWWISKQIETGKVTTEKDNLEILNKLVWIVKTRPELYSQVFDSFTQLINMNLTKENAQQIKDAVEQYPEIKSLYERWAELRWAILKNKPSIISTPIKKVPTLQEIVKTTPSEPLPTNLPPVWAIAPTKKKMSLADLIESVKQQKIQPLFSESKNQPKRLSLAEIIALSKK